MPFTAAELENAANAAIEFHYMPGKVFSQTLQDRPLFSKMMAKQKTFPGGKDNLTVRVKGTYTTAFEGFSADGQVSYSNPTNIKQATYPWKLLHAGIQFTKHELLKSGISIVDNGAKQTESRASKQEAILLADLLNDKIEDMKEGSERSKNLIMWRDGTQDSDVYPGIRSFILDDPTSATVVGGIDQSANSWWRNRASLSINAATPSNQNLVNELQKEFRQLRRYGGRPDCAYAGSDFMDAFEKELRDKGNYTETGWANKGRIDAGVADLAFKGVDIMYDPTLDDESLAKYCYVLDSRTIFPMVIDGENMQKHQPARPEDKYVFYRAVTWVGGLVCTQRNANGVYSIA